MDETVLGLMCVLLFILTIYLEFRDIENSIKKLSDKIDDLSERK